MSTAITDDEKLKQNLKDQLSRLMNEMIDLEECKNDFDEAEYQKSKEDILDQIKEFEERFQKIVAGNLSLFDKLSTVHMATQAAISKCFQTPSVVKMFAGREIQQLRERLETIDRDIKLDSSALEKRNREKVEILTALRELKEQLAPQENSFLAEHTKSMNTPSNTCAFVQATHNIASEKAFNLATSEIQNLAKK